MADDADMICFIEAVTAMNILYTSPLAMTGHAGQAYFDAFAERAAKSAALAPSDGVLYRQLGYTMPEIVGDKH